MYTESLFEVKPTVNLRIFTKRKQDDILPIANSIVTIIYSNIVRILSLEGSTSPLETIVTIAAGAFDSLFSLYR